ncbi:hypothetical protein [Bartonella apis]|uniref:hypothetical protein n=1 Tax=Bartonella apis TaxID=1686310 RepID=UPI00242E8005|nr:hypothetical protein [Bartonella apis]
MPAGLKIFNDAGIIQIDDAYQNFFIVRSGSLTTDDKGLADLWIDWNGPVIVATSSPNGSCCAVQNRQGTNWLYRVGSAVPNDTVRWFAYSLPQYTPFAGGLRIYREDGSIAFDSNQRPLDISHFFNLDAPLLPDYSGHAVDALPKSDEIAYPKDIYIPLKQGHSYTAFPIRCTGTASVVYQAKVKNGGSTGKIPWYEHYCYMPQTWNGGVNFKPIKESEGGRDPIIPDFYRPRGMYYYPAKVQQFWVIDITGL